MNIPINVAAAKHLDNLAKEQARNNVKLTEQLHQKQLCKCEYKSPFKDCPNCGPEYWESKKESTTKNL